MISKIFVLSLCMLLEHCSSGDDSKMRQAHLPRELYVVSRLRSGRLEYLTTSGSWRRDIALAKRFCTLERALRFKTTLDFIMVIYDTTECGE